MFAGCLTSFLLNMMFFCYTVYSSIREAEKGGGIHMEELPNKYTLMHKDIPVAGIMVDPALGAVISIGRVYESLMCRWGFRSEMGRWTACRGI